MVLRIPAGEDRQEDREPERGGHVFPLSSAQSTIFFFFPLLYYGFQSSVISNNVAPVHFMLEFTGFSIR